MGTHHCTDPQHHVHDADGFVEAAANFTDFNDAVRNKIRIETGTIDPGTVPEPGSLALIGLGLLAMGGLRRHKAKA